MAIFSHNCSTQEQTMMASPAENPVLSTKEHSVASLVCTGAIQGAGVKPNPNVKLEDTISSVFHVKYKAVPTSPDLVGKRFNCRPAIAGRVPNASYLWFERNWTTLSRMDEICRLVVTAGGCDFKIYQSTDGCFQVANIAAPPDARGGLNKLQNFAKANQWEEILCVSTAPTQATTAEVMVVSQLFVGEQIETVRLELSRDGFIMACQLYVVNLRKEHLARKGSPNHRSSGNNDSFDSSNLKPTPV